MAGSAPTDISVVARVAPKRLTFWRWAYFETLATRRDHGYIVCDTVLYMYMIKYMSESMRDSQITIRAE